MGIKIPFKNCEDAYGAIKANLLVKDYVVGELQKIDYGVQFLVGKNSQQSLVRIYSSQKKGTTLDISQIKYKSTEEDVKAALNIDTEEIKSVFDNDYKYKLYSLNVGINDFSDTDYGSLDFAENDARSLHEKIQNKFGFGDGTYCLIGREATIAKIIGSFKKIAELAREDDTVFISFSTHGDFLYNEEEKPDFYLITADSDSSDLSKTSLPMEYLKAELSKIKAERKIILLDACYSGGIAKKRNDQKRIPEATKEIIFKRFQSDEYIIITSSQSSQTSWECKNLRHGVFTYYLLSGLSGAVEFQNGLVEVATLYLYLHKSVSKYVKEKFKMKQDPKFFGNFTGNFGLPLLIEIIELQKATSLREKDRFRFETVKCIGIDESGKGDYFGPLTIAAVYVDTEEKISKLISIGVRDSKSLSDQKIKVIAKQIKSICNHEVLHISPKRYNEMWGNMANMNQVLAWSHAQCLESVLRKNTDCNLAISDQFAAKEVLLNRLKAYGKTIELVQRPKAEENIAVAAASILARDRYLEMLEMMQKTYKHPFCRGANEQVAKVAASFLLMNKDLSEVAKIHFKITKQAEKFAMQLKNPKSTEG